MVDEVVIAPTDVNKVPNEVPPQPADASIPDQADVAIPENISDTGTEVAETPTAESEEGEHRSRAKERIQDLVAERKAAMEYADYWRQKALEVLQPPAPTKPPEQPRETSAPELKDFNNDQGKWQSAYNKWNDSQVDIKVQRALEKVETTKTQTATLEAFTQKIEKFKESHSDFDIVIANPKLPVLDRTASAMIVASDHGADITYALAKDPPLAERISRMNPTQQALAIGRLEAQVSKLQPEVNPTPSLDNRTSKPKAETATKAKPAPSTNAPPPPTPVPSGGTSDPSPANMDKYEWMKMRNKEARNGRRRY